MAASSRQPLPPPPPPPASLLGLRGGERAAGPHLGRRRWAAGRGRGGSGGESRGPSAKRPGRGPGGGSVFSLRPPRVRLASLLAHRLSLRFHFSPKPLLSPPPPSPPLPSITKILLAPWPPLLSPLSPTPPLSLLLKSSSPPLSPPLLSPLPPTWLGQQETADPQTDRADLSPGAAGGQQRGCPLLTLSPRPPSPKALPFAWAPGSAVRIYADPRGAELAHRSRLCSRMPWSKPHARTWPARPPTETAGGRGHACPARECWGSRGRPGRGGVGGPGSILEHQREGMDEQWGSGLAQVSAAPAPPGAMHAVGLSDCSLWMSPSGGFSFAHTEA